MSARPKPKDCHQFQQKMASRCEKEFVHQMSARPKPKDCHQFQEKMARRREKEFVHNQTWGNQVAYYKKFEDVNSRMDTWTSPRYYETNTELLTKIKKDKERKENLEKRREKLKALLAEDDASYEIEAMMLKAKHMNKDRATRLDEIPTELLKDVNIGLKIDEEDRRKREAELKLYHQWRNNNPILRQAERTRNTKELKLSWLDQQIEKRMSKEKEEEECRRILKERDKNIQTERMMEQRLQEEAERKNKELKEHLLQQMEEIKEKLKISEDLKREEGDELKKQHQVHELKQKLKSQEEFKRNKEVAIFNLKQYKMKLKNLALQADEDIAAQQNLVAEIIRSKTADRIKDQLTKQEVKTALDEFLAFTKEQKLLEKKRREYLDFIFDSEAKEAYEKQKEIWGGEERSRKELLRDVLATIEGQINENIKRNQEKQKELLEERERMLEDMEAYEKELEENKKLEASEKAKIKKQIDKQVNDKKAQERKLKELGRKNYDAELESMRAEEERLKQEILKIQNSHAPLRYARKKPWYY